MAAPAKPSVPSPVQGLNEAFERTLANYPKNEQGSIRQQWQQTFGKAKNTAELSTAARNFSSYLNTVNKQWDGAVDQSTLDQRSKFLEKRKNRELLAPLREVTKTGFKLAPAKMTPLTRGEKLATDISLGARRGGLIGAGAAALTDFVTGSPFYLPPGYQEDTLVSGVAQAGSMAGEFLIPGLGAITGSGKAIAAPKAVDAVLRGIGKAGTLAAAPQAKLAELGGMGAMRLAGLSTGAPTAGGVAGLRQAIRATAQGQRGSIPQLLDQAGRTGIAGIGVGGALGAFQGALPFIPAVRPAMDQIDPTTGAQVVGRTPGPTLRSIVESTSMGALGGGVGALVPGLVGPVGTRAGTIGLEVGSELASLAPDVLIQLATQGKIDWGEVARQIPAAIAGGVVSGAMGPGVTPAPAAPPPPPAPPAPTPGAPPTPPTTPLQAAADAAAGPTATAATVPAPPAPTPAPPAPPTTPTTTPGELPKLPRALSKAAPKYNQTSLDFESDVDRAMYIVANQGNKSRADNEYLNWLADTLGLSRSEILQQAKAVKQAVVSIASRAEAGKPARIPSLLMRQPEPPSAPAAPPAPAEAPVPAGAQPTAEPTQEAEDGADEPLTEDDYRTGIIDALGEGDEKVAALIAWMANNDGFDGPGLLAQARSGIPASAPTPNAAPAPEPTAAPAAPDLESQLARGPDGAILNLRSLNAQLLNTDKAIARAQKALADVPDAEKPGVQAVLDTLTKTRSTIEQNIANFKAYRSAQTAAAKPTAPAESTPAPAPAPEVATIPENIATLKSDARARMTELKGQSVTPIVPAVTKGAQGMGFVMSRLNKVGLGEMSVNDAYDEIVGMLQKDGVIDEEGNSPYTAEQIEATYGLTPAIVDFLTASEPAAPGERPEAEAAMLPEPRPIEMDEATLRRDWELASAIDSLMLTDDELDKPWRGHSRESMTDIAPKVAAIVQAEPDSPLASAKTFRDLYNALEDMAVSRLGGTLSAAQEIEAEVLPDGVATRIDATLRPEPGELPPGARMEEGPVVPFVPAGANREWGTPKPWLEQQIPITIGGIKLPNAFTARWLGNRNPDRSWLEVGLTDATNLRIKMHPDERGVHPWEQVTVSELGPSGKIVVLNSGTLSTPQYNSFSQYIWHGSIQEPTQRAASIRLAIQKREESRQALRKLFGLLRDEFSQAQVPDNRDQFRQVEGPLLQTVEEVQVDPLQLPNLASAYQWFNASPGVQTLAAAVQNATQMPPTGPTTPQTAVESAVLTPAVQQALQQGQPAPSWAKQGATKAVGEVAKQAASVQRIKTRINKVARDISNGAINKTISAFGSSIRFGVDPDTLRSEAGTALVRFLNASANGLVQFGTDLVNTGKRALGMPAAPLGQSVPPSLYALRDQQAQQIAAGELAAARIEEYLATKYDSSILDQLEQILENGGKLPAPYDQDPILQAFMGALPTMMTQLEAIGAVRPDQVARADRFLIRTMVPQGTGFASALGSLQTLIGGASSNPRLKQFAYGQGNVQQMPEAEFLEYSRPWKEDPTQRTATTMTIRDGVSSKVVSTVYNPATGTIEAADYVRWNPQTNDWENPWIEVGGAETGNIKASRDWTTEELNANGIVRNLATTAFKTLSFWTNALSRGVMYDAIIANGGMLDNQLVAVKQADVRNPNMLEGGIGNWSDPLRGKQWGVLQGYRVRKDVLEFVRNAQQEGKLLGVVEGMAREYKRTRTTLSAGYMLTNLLGNHGMLLVNGGSGADIPEALLTMINKSPQFLEFARNGAYEGTTMQEMLRERQRAGSEPGSMTEAAISGISQKLDSATDAMTKKLVAAMGGKPMTAENIMAGLRDVARSANPIVFNKFVDDLYRTALGVGVLREGGTMQGAVKRMREDMYNVMRPRTQTGRFLTATVFPWASWPIWATQNVPRIAAQNWQAATVNILMLAAMSAINEALVFSDESEEEKQKRREAERAGAYTQTTFGLPDRLYITKNLSLRTGTANPFELFQQAADVLRSYAETGSISEATGMAQGFRKLPIRPSGPVVGLFAALRGQDPLRPDRPLPESLEGLSNLALEAAFPAATNLVRGLYNQEMFSAGESTPAGLGAAAQIARALGPFDIRNLDKDIQGQVAALNRIQNETNEKVANLRRQLENPYSPVRVSEADFAERLQRVYEEKIYKQAPILRKIEALTQYRATQPPSPASQSPLMPVR